MSVFLGTVPKGRRRVRDVILNGEGHVSVCAGPGSYKTTSVVCPTLIRGLGHSAIILDPSGENYSICAHALRRAGVDVRVMSAFPSRVSRLIRQDVVDVGCDIYSGVSPNMPGPEIRAVLKKAARWIIPDEPDQDAKDRFFVADARELIEFVSMYLMIRQQKPTLPAVHDVVMQGMQHLADLYVECEEKYPDYFGGAFAKLAQSFGGVQAAAGQQAAGGFGQAKLSLSHFDPSSELGRHTSGSEWDPAELGDPSKRVALFLIGTLEMMETYAGPTATTLMYLFDTIASHNLGGRVTALLDECGSLALTSLPGSLLFYRKTGLRCVMIWQDLEGQAMQKMGRHGVKQILSGSRHLMISGGSTEWETLERFSKLCGTRTCGTSKRCLGTPTWRRPRSTPVFRSASFRRCMRRRTLRRASGSRAGAIGRESAAKWTGLMLRVVDFSYRPLGEADLPPSRARGPSMPRVGGLNGHREGWSESTGRYFLTERS